MKDQILHDAILATLRFWSGRYVEHMADGNIEQAIVALRAFTRMLDWVEISTDDQTN